MEVTSHRDEVELLQDAVQLVIQQDETSGQHLSADQGIIDVCRFRLASVVSHKYHIYSSCSGHSSPAIVLMISILGHMSSPQVMIPTRR